MSTINNQSRQTVSRRSVAKGAAWSVPVITVATSAPAIAASSTPPTGTACGTISYPGSATTSPSASGAIVPMSLSNGTTIYAKFTTNTSGSRQSSNTSPYNATFGRRAYGSVAGVYDPSYKSQNNFVFNQMSGKPSSETVTVSFYSDAAATQPVSVNNISVPINDVSTGISWNCGLFNTNCTVDAARSYQDVVTLSGTTATGQIVAPSSTTMSVTGTQNASTPTSYSGNLSSGLYLSTAPLLANPNSGGTTQVVAVTGGFGSTALTSFTFGYTSNVESAAASFTGAQGVSLGTFTVCR